MDGLGFEVFGEDFLDDGAGVFAAAFAVIEHGADDDFGVVGGGEGGAPDVFAAGAVVVVFGGAGFAGDFDAFNLHGLSGAAGDGGFHAFDDGADVFVCPGEVADE